MTCRLRAEPMSPQRRRLLASALAVGVAPLLAPTRARAATVLAQPPVAQIDADGLYVSTSVVFALPRALEDALLHGVPLSFRTVITLSRARWWWMDQTVAEIQQRTRLVYQPLLEKYRLSSGALQHSVPTLDAALSQIQHLLHQKLAGSAQLENGQSYQIGGRFELDLSELPRPFQINVGAQSDWQLQADFPRVPLTWQAPASPG